MANVAHSTLTGSNLHEPKGASTAAAGEVYVANGSGSGAWTASGTVVTGMVADFGTPLAPSGWLELDGSSISATTYAALYVALTIQQSGIRGSGSAIITGLSSTTNMRAGYFVAGTGIQAGSTIVTVDSGTQITISLTATSGGTNTVIVSPWQVTTSQIVLPNTTTSGRYRRSRTSALHMGVSQADQNQAHTHTATSSSDGAHAHTVSVSDPGHDHEQNPATLYDAGLGNGPSAAARVGGLNTANRTDPDFTGITATVDSQGAHTHTLTTTSNGGTEARPLTLIVMTCIKT